MFKYPRTPHLVHSELQQGDDLKVVQFNEIKDKPLVIEEKVDGANSAIRFNSDGKLILQSRGHILMGGPREKQFALLKSWAATHTQELWNCLGPNLVVFGEWLYTKHSKFYDQLPHYFLEFDVFDIQKQEFWSTEMRHELLPNFIRHVPVLSEGQFQTIDDIKSLITTSLFISENYQENLHAQCKLYNVNPDMTEEQTDMNRLAEGLYIKWEENGIVKGRYKFVRNKFKQHIIEGDGHWMDRPIVPNIMVGQIYD